MKFNIKSFVLGFIACAIMGSTTVYAADSTKIEVYFKKLKFVFNGTEKAPDSNSQGFIYQGTTYVPLRFISESLNKEVSLDSRTGAMWVSNHPGVLSMEDLSIKDTLKKSIINIGMSKIEVEQKLGDATDDYRNLYNYNGLEVFYRDDKVAGLMVRGGNNTTNHLQTSKNIGLGDKFEEIFSNYGNGFVDERAHAVTFRYINEKGKLNKIDVSEELKDPASAYVLSISYSDNSNKTISMILIGDFQFAYLNQ